MLQPALKHLEALVGFDTRNPPRAISTGGIFDYLRQQLLDFQIEVNDHGAGAVSMLARRGSPKRLFNVHLDTVPSASSWTQDPLQLRVTQDRAIGLGACDIKGAAACLLAAASETRGDAAFLFSTDEEANDARCIEAFLNTDHGFKEVIVAEPTMAEAVIAHRGIASVLIQFSGRSAHASADKAIADSAVHSAMVWGAQALQRVQEMQHLRFGGLTGLRMNIGRIEGGIKANMIAANCELRFGFRPLPSQPIDELHEVFRDCLPPDCVANYAQTFRGPSLPAGATHLAEEKRLAARDLADELGLPIGNAVDFWTEASLFSAAGLTALVYGPGDIAQAHTADEWVSLQQLETVLTTYKRLLS